MRQTILKLGIYFLLILFVQESYSHNALPVLKNYDKSTYKAGRQNWDLDIDPHGIVYFANTDGLLCNIYGEWKLYETPQKKTLRSVYVETDTIWCGGEEFGFFERQGNSLLFHDLGQLQGGHVWNIEPTENGIVFQTENDLLFFNKENGSIKRIPLPHQIWSIALWKSKLWVILRNNQIGYIENEKFHLVATSDYLDKKEVRKLFNFNGKLYIVLFEGGILSFDGTYVQKVDLPKKLEDVSFFSGIPYDENHFCLGTITEGFLLLNDKNEVTRKVNVNNGLIENTVLSMQKDALGNVWLGLDYGIAKVELNSAVYPIFKGAATYFIKKFGNETFLATNKGLFHAHENQEFHFYDNPVGQVWMVKNFGNDLFVCHNHGLFKLQNDNLLPSEIYAGFMDIAHFEGTNFFVLSTYHGLMLAERNGDRFDITRELNVWELPKLVYDQENKCIWAVIKNAYVMKLSLKKDLNVKMESFKNIKKLFNTNKGIYFSDSTKILRYKNERFYEPNLFFDDGTNTTAIQAIDFSEEGKAVAYIQNGDVKLKMQLSDGSLHDFSNQLKSLSNKIIHNDEFIKIIKNKLYIATDRGVTVFDIGYRSDFERNSAPIISSVSILNNNEPTIYFPFPENGITLDAGDKDLKLRFATNKSSYDIAEYRYRLSERERWSDWFMDKDEIICAGLGGGEYNFQLQCRINGQVIEEVSLPISIEKHWYQTSWIILPVSLIALLWVFGVVFIMSAINKKKLKSQEKKFSDENAQKTLTLKNEQLLQYTEIISHKNEFLNKVKSGLEKMRNSDAQRWANLITEEVNNEKKEFLFHKLFSEIHQDFIARLTEAYPTLTANDVRILSFIRINLGNHEISNLMNITPRSLDTNRYRIRKKLALEHDVDLNKFIRNF